MKPLIAALLLCAGTARAEVTWAWTRTDLAMQAAFVGVTSLDWMQTIYFTQVDLTHGSERNPILGPWPSRAKVNTLIPLGMAAHTAVAAALPHGKLRSVWQCVWIVAETGVVVNNRYNYGVGFALPWR